MPTLYYLMNLKQSQVKRDEQKWIEIAVYADDSVVNFHGKESIER